MPVKNETSTRFMDEVRIIPRWVFFFAALVFVGIIAALPIVTHGDKDAPPAVVMGLLGIIPGTLLACFILLIGYINQDAGRRGMSRVLWTLLAIFIPNALGIVLYFILRKPRMSHCPQCSAVVEPQFGFCPRCRCRLGPVCPQCQRGANAGDKFCPYCGADLGAVNGAAVNSEKKNQ
jgi:RNA polymerase subunit RPABC4/transcription elongation factor Spt4